MPTLLALVLSACAATPATLIVRLEISADEAYLVDGTAVETEGLATALSAKRRAGEELLVHVIPQPGTRYEAVHRAVEAVQKVGATTGMVGNVRF